jgi:hypothetical protein
MLKKWPMRFFTEAPTILAFGLINSFNNTNHGQGRPHTEDKKMLIKYTASVKTPAGWRSELITARAEPITDKRLRVVEVIDIGGNGASGYASRTGAKRQQYNVGYFARQQIGAVKLLNFVKVELQA